MREKKECINKSSKKTNTFNYLHIYTTRSLKQSIRSLMAEIISEWGKYLINILLANIQYILDKVENIN